jgi:uncharacterized protein YgiM (DUF1202 family)
MATPRHRAPRSARAIWRAAAWLALAAGICGPGIASAEQAWVKDELRLNLRSGPGVQYRIMGIVKTGDGVAVLSRGEGWTQVRVPEVGEGWIPEGYLQSEPPAGARLAESEAQTSKFREQLSAIQEEAQNLRQQNGEITARDAKQRDAIERLTRENLELHAGARWPEWITGAGILGAGMLLGAVLHMVSARRQRPRLRL